MYIYFDYIPLLAWISAVSASRKLPEWEGGENG